LQHELLLFGVYIRSRLALVPNLLADSFGHGTLPYVVY